MQRLFFSLLSVVFLLSACAVTPVTSEDIVMSGEITDAENWARYFPDLYNPIMACVKAHPRQPAYVMEAGPMNHGKAYARVMGKDHIVYDCVIDMVADQPEHFKIVRDAAARGPSFYPTRYGQPRDSKKCLRVDAVTTTKGRVLGWLEMPDPACIAVEQKEETLPFALD